MPTSRATKHRQEKLTDDRFNNCSGARHRSDRGDVTIAEGGQDDEVEIIWVNIKTEYWSDKLPQIWDEMRRKIREVETTLPPGAGRPLVNDGFGDVYGLLMAVTGDGYSYAEREEAVKGLKKELSLVEGVARVELWGGNRKSFTWMPRKIN